jgi:hypothetical protein
MRTIRTAIARRLRRWAQRLSPLLTEAQIRNLRNYYDNHDSITGQKIRRHHINVYGTVDPAVVEGLAGRHRPGADR